MSKATNAKDKDPSGAKASSDQQSGCLYSPLVTLFVAPLVVALVAAFVLQDARFGPSGPELPGVQPVLTIVVVSATAPADKEAPGEPDFDAIVPTITPISFEPTVVATPPAAAAPAPAPVGAGSTGSTSGTICDTATVVGVTALSVRAAPTRQSARLAEVPAGAQVQLFCDAPVAADERVWLRVRAGEIVGYMSDRYLSVGNQARASDLCGRARVVGVEALSIRAAPSRQSEQLGAIKVGELVDVLCDAPISADERVWLRVRAGKVEGYMSDRYLSRENE